MPSIKGTSLSKFLLYLGMKVTLILTDIIAIRQLSCLQTCTVTGSYSL